MAKKDLSKPVGIMGQKYSYFCDLVKDTNIGVCIEVGEVGYLTLSCRSHDHVIPIELCTPVKED